VTSGLRRFLQPAQRAKPGERCEMCTEPVTEDHSHVIDLESRAIMCTCRGCYLLFTHNGAGGKRHRAVPERYLHARSFTLGAALWESIGIPVLDTTVAFYPSPAGATESLLPLGAWEEMLASNSELATVSPDVEALLINKNDEDFECFLVPIDVCYELVGLVRLHWRGFDGGTEAWQAIDGFFGQLRERATQVGPADG
jgi:hypothetical protein